MIDIDWRPDKRKLRVFGILSAVGFFLLGSASYLGLFGFESQTVPWALWCAGAVTGLLGMSGSRAALVAYMPMMFVGLVMGTVVSTVLLVSFYTIVITPMGLLMRMAGRDGLGLEKRTHSYWEKVDYVPGREDYEKPY